MWSDLNGLQTRCHLQINDSTNLEEKEIVGNYKLLYVLLQVCPMHRGEHPTRNRSFLETLSFTKLVNDKKKTRKYIIIAIWLTLHNVVHNFMIHKFYSIILLFFITIF